MVGGGKTYVGEGTQILVRKYEFQKMSNKNVGKKRVQGTRKRNSRQEPEWKYT